MRTPTHHFSRPKERPIRRRPVRRVFQVDGYEGDYSVTVPDGVQKGGMFQFDGDLKRCAAASCLLRYLQAEDLRAQVA